MSQLPLLKSRRFLPLFWTQFLGAFNDNVYKNALVILIIFQNASLFGLDSNQLVTMSAGIFILPYFLFSATAGQLADKYEKSRLIRWIKILEIIIMLLAIAGFYFADVFSLIVLLFLMGAQATLFGPLKYGILPQHLHENELMAGNGLIEMGTFLAILLGTILGGIVVAIQPNGSLIVAGVVVFISILGWLASLWIPPAEAADPKIKINWNIAYETWHTLQYGAENRSVFLALLAISWFWLVGATFLSQFPAYSKEILHGNEHVITLLLTVFSIGIGTGSTLCDKLSGGRVELGLVVLGAIGISLFSIDVYFASQGLAQFAATAPLIDVSAFLAKLAHWRILADLLLIGLFGGFYIVPLYVLMQQRSNPHHRSRVIAANNILNALLMVLSALATVWMLKMGMNSPQIFLVTGISSAGVTFVLFLLQPEFMQSFVRWTGLRKAD
ncbi:MAG: hypothetical protein RIS84_1994 [Pseudomonadota bacterium]|jgi:hypothetical protein